MAKKVKSDIEIAKKQYDEALESGQIKKSDENKRFASFFLYLSENSLSTANILSEISKNTKNRESLGIDKFYNGDMWIVVTCYYSMFYMASALIAKKGVKVGEESTHKNVKNAFLRLYIENGDLERKLGIEYSEAKKLAEDLMQERDKRGKYQYNVGNTILRKDAETSLKRAKNFFEKTRKLLKG